MSESTAGLLSNEFLMRLKSRGVTHNPRVGYAVERGWVILRYDGADALPVDWAATEQEAEIKVKAFYAEDCECESAENKPVKYRGGSTAKKCGKAAK